jgi:predicted MarR family transcription regulator
MEVLIIHYGTWKLDQLNVCTTLQKSDTCNIERSFKLYRNASITKRTKTMKNRTFSISAKLNHPEFCPINLLRLDVEYLTKHQSMVQDLKG